MRTFDPDRVRRALARRGIVPAVAVADAASGRADDAVIRPAELLEDAVLTAHAVGVPEAWTEPVAFLDGTQRTTVVGYSATSTIVVAWIGAETASWSPAARSVALPIANLATFAALWVVQFVVLDRVIFHHERSPIGALG